jgi:CHAD domain-containing protein
MSRPPAPRKWQAPVQQPGVSTRQFGAAILRAALDQAAANLPGALESGNPEYVHQLRVGLRRYRSALRLFRGAMRKKARKRLAGRARNAMRPLGEVRDLDVLLQRLQKAKAPADLRRRVAQRAAAARKALTRIDLSRLASLPEAWKDDSGPLDAFRPRALSKARRKVAQRLDGLDWNDAEARHRLRIAVKRLRYAANFLGDKTRAVEALQDTLGDLNDLAVARRLLARLNPPPRLLQKLAADERRLLAAARRQVAALKLED